ncbi:hypothetical protein PYJP_14550 [Pyrofollis japonicus]|uniref:hypothetical protein n=1 Tax=Pyrofollis japonicus TaxID=3060460 RepID=UPI00295A6930|nr:hypothetical protein [Pyrofollis japonicus]BEP18103.1 hypothetical protein PYJP_14550 [Pyrofollis japonicus]
MRLTRQRQVVAWLRDSELAHKFLRLANALGLEIKKPRRLDGLCDENTIVITDDDLLKETVSSHCEILFIETSNKLKALIEVLQALKGPSSETVIGIDLGSNSLAYVVLAHGTVIDYGICSECLEKFALQVCSIKGYNVYVGIGSTPAVYDKAIELYERLKECGIKAVLVDERKSNKAILIGLKGTELLRKTDLRAAVAVALRSRLRGNH